jgi:hypothetical protein
VVIETASLIIENCPAGLLSTKDALDDGNAYGSALQRLRTQVYMPVETWVNAVIGVQFERDI